MAFAVTRPIPFQKLDPVKDFKPGCRCTVNNAQGETFVFSTMKDKAPAIIRFDGNQQELKWLSSTEKKDVSKVDETFSRTYGAGPIRLKLNYTTTAVCKEQEDTCEGTQYSVISILEEGSTRRSETKALTSLCGCPKK
jgi:hypothetical protein